MSTGANRDFDPWPNSRGAEFATESAPSWAQNVELQKTGDGLRPHELAATKLRFKGMCVLFGWFWSKNPWVSLVELVVSHLPRKPIYLP